MKSERYIVLINEGNGWEECGEGEMTQKQAERIAKEIRQDCGCRAKTMPAQAMEIFFSKHD